MIKSMTGFGKAEASLPNKKISVEIRSLNSKQLDLNLRLPSLYRQLEVEVRNLISKVVLRGKVDVFISVETAKAETSVEINKEAFKEYFNELKQAAQFADAEVNDSVLISSVMRLPDVISSPTEMLSDEESKVLLDTVKTAAVQLDAFRLQEGAVLIQDLLHRVDKIEGYKQEVIPYEKQRTETIKQRILDGLKDLNVEVDHNRLEQEMIFYIEKLDITEEKVRLSNHCKYFREVSASEEAVGRKLNFIAQEMGREINTMGSKANESNIQILVVKMKDELEKIKEQVLNIL